jgi:glycosyltransferase involved in cell wall biosynthesis
MISGRDIICISTSDWNGPWGSKQQLMSGLSASNRVLYVEYQTSFIHLFLKDSKSAGNSGPLRQIGKNLFIFRPPWSLPLGYYFRSINRINQKRLSSALKQAIAELGFKNPILWACLPSAADLLASINAKLILYHCIADFPDEKKNSLRKKTILSMEEDLARSSHLVLAMTQSLYERFKMINNNTHLFRSAVSDELFLSSRGQENRQPADIAAINRPRIGVVGYLDGKIIDTDLLSYVADARPTWSLVFIGPAFRHTSALNTLRARKNVYFLGKKRHDEMPGYIGSLDVCAIPYRLNKFTNNVSPIKLYEYMAMGKPVVSTKLSETDGFRGLIRVSDMKEAFIKDIELSLIEDNK